MYPLFNTPGPELSILASERQVAESRYLNGLKLPSRCSLTRLLPNPACLRVRALLLKFDISMVSKYSHAAIKDSGGDESMANPIMD